MPDKTLTCSDCGQEFIFTVEEQEFYTARGFTEPKRCRSCRAARRNERAARVQATLLNKRQRERVAKFITAEARVRPLTGSTTPKWCSV